MSVLSLTVKVGEGVAIGDLAYIAVREKKGQRVRLVIGSNIAPIRIDAWGIIPREYEGIKQRASAVFKPTHVAATG